MGSARFVPDKQCRPTPLEALRAAIEAATGESVTISKDAAEEALRWLERAVQIAEQRDRWGEELDHTHRLLRGVCAQVQEASTAKERYELGDAEPRDLPGLLGWRRLKRRDMKAVPGELVFAFWSLTSPEASEPQGWRSLVDHREGRVKRFGAAPMTGDDALAEIANFFGFKNANSARTALIKAMKKLSKEASFSFTTKMLSEITIPADPP